MKNIVAITLIALGLSACADTRSSAHKDATTWERIHYQVQDSK